MNLVYFIRSTRGLRAERIVEPRTRDTMRRSLDGDWAIVAFPEGEEPTTWTGGMTEDECRELVTSAGAQGVWWEPEELV